MTKATYIGDGVYAEFDGYQLCIYTDNGLGRSDKIYLEVEVLANLNKFAKENRPKK